MLTVAVMPAGADVILTVTCTTDTATATEEFTIPCAGDVIDWVMDDPVEVRDDYDVLLGTITQLELASDEEPFVNLFFAVQAGASDTTFDVLSPLISFSALSDPPAYASAGVTLTSDSDGATITGLFGGDTYEARYNGTSVYDDLVAGFNIPGDQTLTSSERSPVSGYSTITGTVSNIQSEFYFTLSAEDQASGTSRFEVVPEPVAMSLLALGAAAIVYRRRRR
jgi:hypothetical protein